MFDWHKKRSEDEFYVAELDKHLKNDKTRESWDKIVAFDPMGWFAHPPTMAAVYSSVLIPEVQFEVDGKIVREDGRANVLKLAMDYVWDMKRMSERLEMDEDKFRASLVKYTQNEKIADKSRRLYLPPVGGCTCYIFGDVSLLGKESTEVAVRVHDSCCGSDVFGTDICTCRPYLVFAVKAAVECAQRGGVGVVSFFSLSFSNLLFFGISADIQFSFSSFTQIIYYQKEGRSLGEVTKFRVYNARKAQKGGDRSETYFFHTENIAGIRDARFQEMMPDALHFLGIKRIDWLLSMSSDKYDGITQAGIQVMQRVALPDYWVPKEALVEIGAKIAGSFFSPFFFPPFSIFDSNSDCPTHSWLPLRQG
jgi:GTP cyclohydrolase II